MEVYTRCNADIDCPGTTVCYKALAWMPHKVINDGAGYCACSGYEGNTGVNCTDTGPGTIFLYTGSSILLLFSFILFLSCLVIYVKMQKRKKLRPSPAVGTLTLALFATIFIIIHNATRIYETATPGHIVHVERSDGNHKVHEAFPIMIWSTMLMILFTVSSALNVSLVWVHTALKTKAFKRKGDFKRYYKIIIALQVSWFILAVIFIGISKEKDMAFPGFIYLIITFTTYCVGERKIIALMRTSGRGSNQPNPYYQLIRNIKITANMIYVSGTILLIAGLSYTVLNIIDMRNPGEIEQPGKLSPILISWEFEVLGFTMVNGAVIWYLNSCLITSKKSQASKTNQDMSYMCCCIPIGSSKSTDQGTQIPKHPTAKQSTVEHTRNTKKTTEAETVPQDDTITDREKSLYAN